MKLTTTKLQEPKLKRRQRNSNYNNHALSGVRKPESTKYTLSGKHPENPDQEVAIEVELTPSQSLRVTAISKKSEPMMAYIKTDKVKLSFVDIETTVEDGSLYGSSKFETYAVASGRQSGKTLLQFKILKNRVSYNNNYEYEYNSRAVDYKEVYSIELPTSEQCVLACLSCLQPSQYNRALKSKDLSSLVRYIVTFVIGKSLYE